MQRLMPLAVICGLCFLIIYFLTLPISIPDGDAGEFIVLSKFGGIAHPPGYPLYVSLLRLVGGLTVPLPYVSLLALVSALSAALAAGILFYVVASHAGAMAAAFAVGTAFLSAPVWRSATSIEPFGLNLLLIAAVLLVVSRLIDQCSPEKPRWTDVAILGALFGLGFCNHHTLVFFAPAALFAMLWHCRNRIAWLCGGLAAFTFGFAIGCLPLLTLFSSDTAVPLTWGTIESFPQFMHHLLRRDYGTLSLSGKDAGSGLDMLSHFLKVTPAYFSWLPFGVALLGVAFGLKLFTASGFQTARSRMQLCWLISLVSSIMFLLLFNVDVSQPLSQHMVERFLHVPYIALTGVIALGFCALQHRRVGGIIPALAVVTLTLHLLLQLPIADRSRETFAEVDIYNTFDSLRGFEAPVLVTYSDAEFLGYLYGKHVLGLGGDVTVLHPGMWLADWYFKNAVEGLDLDAADPPQEFPALLDRLLEDKRNVFLSSPSSEDISRFLAHSYPFGRLIHLLPEAAHRPDNPTVFGINSKLFAWTYTLPAHPQWLNAWEGMLFERYAEPMQVFRLTSQNIRLRADLIDSSSKRF